MSLFDALPPIEIDPIFGLAQVIQKDERSNKIDLTVGVYRDVELKTPIFDAVRLAVQLITKREKDKGYLPILGDRGFLQKSGQLLFGEKLYQEVESKLVGGSMIGGTGALSIGLGIGVRYVSRRVYLPEPTWGNHHTILSMQQGEVKTYPYYDPVNRSIDWEGMLKTFAKAPPKSLVLLHACGHNPTGVDLTKEQWKHLSSLLLEKQCIPFFDMAYLGFASSIDEDTFPIRYFAREGHEMLVAHSFSKSFGLYGERVGTLWLLTDTPHKLQLASALKKQVRSHFSNPPRHGAFIVKQILDDPDLTMLWRKELDHMRKRVDSMRALLSQKCAALDYVSKGRGLFSLLPIEKEAVMKLRDSYAIYLTERGRINIAGLTEHNIGHFTHSLKEVGIE